jgi:hypothetical protein
MAASEPVTSAARVADAHPRVLAQPDVPAAARVLASAFVVEPGNVALYPDAGAA